MKDEITEEGVEKESFFAKSYPFEVKESVPEDTPQPIVLALKTCVVKLKDVRVTLEKGTEVKGLGREEIEHLKSIGFVEEK